VSLQFSRLQNGGITPSWISRATCSLLPLIVRLLIAHAASFCVWNSPCQQKIYHLLELIVLLMHCTPDHMVTPQKMWSPKCHSYCARISIMIKRSHLNKQSHMPSSVLWEPLISLEVFNVWI
jgi:hypothetical protein